MQSNGSVDQHSLKTDKIEMILEDPANVHWIKVCTAIKIELIQRQVVSLVRPCVNHAMTRFDDRGHRDALISRNRAVVDQGVARNISDPHPHSDDDLSE